jgi:hypothetical protein
MGGVSGAKASPENGGWIAARKRRATQKLSAGKRLSAGKSLSAGERPRADEKLSAGDCRFPAEALAEEGF